MVKRTKAKQVKKATGRARPVKARRANSLAVGGESGARVRRHIGLLLDPCNGELGPCAYRGRDGFITRLMAQSSQTDATGTVAFFAYYPRINRIVNMRKALFTDSFVIDWFDAVWSQAGPGSSYLASVSEGFRPISACVQAFYSGTELDRQGIVYQGVVPVRATVGTFTMGSLVQLLQRSTRTPDHTVETKWIPAPENETYAASNPAAFDYTDVGDNCIIFAVTGVAAGKMNFNYRTTLNAEWLPKSNQGIITPSPNTPDPPAGLEHVRSTISRLGDWWLEAVHTAGTAYRVGRAAYQGTRALAQMAAPAALPLLLA